MELALNWQDRINEDWSYNIGFILADAKTEIASYEGAISKKAGVNKIVEGYPMNSLWVYKTDGLFQNQSEVDAYYSQMTMYSYVRLSIDRCYSYVRLSIDRCYTTYV